MNEVERPVERKVFEELLELCQKLAGKVVAGGATHAPVVLVGKRDGDKMEICKPIFLQNRGPEDMIAARTAINELLSRRQADVAVLVCEGWMAQFFSQAEADAARTKAEAGTSMKEIGGGKSAVVISLYSRDEEYAVINEIDEGPPRVMKLGKLDDTSKFEGRLSIHN